MPIEVLYRYDSRRYSVTLDSERELYGVLDAKLVCEEYQVTVHTPEGYWIGAFDTDKDRWIGKYAKKRYAYPTKAEALEAYILRKKSYKNHCLNNLRSAEEDLRLVEGIIP